LAAIRQAKLTNAPYRRKSDVCVFITSSSSSFSSFLFKKTMMTSKQNNDVFLPCHPSQQYGNAVLYVNTVLYVEIVNEY